MFKNYKSNVFKNDLTFFNVAVFLKEWINMYKYVKNAWIFK